MKNNKISKFKFGLMAFIAASLMPVGAAIAGAPKPIAQHKDWSVFAYDEGGKKTCFAVIQPTESLPKGVRRGSIFFSVTHSQTDKSLNAVSISMGYPLKTDGTHSAVIKGKSYALFGQGETLWPTGPSVEKSLVAGMKAGSTMTVSAVSTRGTKTTDKYSLSGVSAAIAGAKKHCKL